MTYNESTNKGCKKFLHLPYTASEIGLSAKLRQDILCNECNESCCTHAILSILVTNKLCFCSRVGAETLKSHHVFLKHDGFFNTYLQYLSSILIFNTYLQYFYLVIVLTMYLSDETIISEQYRIVFIIFRFN